MLRGMTRDVHVALGIALRARHVDRGEFCPFECIFFPGIMHAYA